MSGNLINRKACKELALRYARDTRKGCSFERVSKQFLDDLETWVLNRITGAIARHPTTGKTIKYLQ